MQSLKGSHSIKRGALQDIDREAGRAEADLLSEIASEEANNQWKTDIAMIAANTSLTELTDPLSETPDIDARSGLASPIALTTNSVDEMLTTTQLDDPLSSFSIQLAQASKSLNTAGIDLSAAANVVRQGGLDLIAAAAYLQRLTIPAPAGGGGGRSLTRSDALAIGDIIADGIQTGEIVGIGSGD